MAPLEYAVVLAMLDQNTRRQAIRILMQFGMDEERIIELLGIYGYSAKTFEEDTRTLTEEELQALDERRYGTLLFLFAAIEIGVELRVFDCSENATLICHAVLSRHCKRHELVRYTADATDLLMRHSGETMGKGDVENLFRCAMTEVVAKFNGNPHPEIVEDEEAAKRLIREAIANKLQEHGYMVDRHAFDAQEPPSPSSLDWN